MECNSDFSFNFSDSYPVCCTSCLVDTCIAVLLLLVLFCD